MDQRLRRAPSRVWTRALSTPARSAIRTAASNDVDAGRDRPRRHRGRATLGDRVDRGSGRGQLGGGPLPRRQQHRGARRRAELALGRRATMRRTGGRPPRRRRPVGRRGSAVPGGSRPAGSSPSPGRRGRARGPARHGPGDPGPPRGRWTPRPRSVAAAGRAARPRTAPRGRWPARRAGPARAPGAGSRRSSGRGPARRRRPKRPGGSVSCTGSPSSTAAGTEASPDLGQAPAQGAQRVVGLGEQQRGEPGPRRRPLGQQQESEQRPALAAAEPVAARLRRSRSADAPAAGRPPLPTGSSRARSARSFRPPSGGRPGTGWHGPTARARAFLARAADDLTRAPAHATRSPSSSASRR